MLTFEQCVLECSANAELVAQFNRLTGCTLGQSLRRSPLDVAIDDATGFSGESVDAMEAFVTFVYDCVWLPLLASNTPEGTP